MGILLKIVSVVVFVGLLTGCSGSESKSTTLRPNPIPSEYKGLSIEALSEQASKMSYKDIIGETGRGAYTSGNDPKIVENISNHEGTLMFASGWVEKIFPSSTEGVFTIWLCSLDEGNFPGRPAKAALNPYFCCMNLIEGRSLKRMTQSLLLA